MRSIAPTAREGPENVRTPQKAPESAQACGGSESTKDWVRHFYKIGQPHEAIKYCLTEIEQRIDRGKKVPGKKVFKYDLMEGMGAPNVETRASGCCSRTSHPRSHC